jgi:hypothetical protein
MNANAVSQRGFTAEILNDFEFCIFTAHLMSLLRLFQFSVLDPALGSAFLQLSQT